MTPLAELLLQTRQAVADQDGRPVDDPEDPVVFVVDPARPKTVVAFRFARMTALLEEREAAERARPATS